jgi:hypothetical protein
MTVDEIISQRYQDLQKLLKNTDTIVYEGLTYDDILNNVLITQLRKFKDTDLDPEEGFEAIKRAVLTEFLFLPKKKGKSKVLLIGDCLLSDDKKSFLNKN